MLTLLLTVIMVVLLLRSVCSRKRRSTADLGAGYSRRQKIFLAPVLAVLWAWHTLTNACRRNQGSTVAVVPAASGEDKALREWN